ncbi:MAG: PAS domain S-box protein, partial [Pseudanabaena sp. ELA748]
MSDISVFLNKLHFSQTGQVFIIERSGEMVATSILAEASATKQRNWKVERISAATSQDVVTREVSKQLTQKFGNFDNIKESEQVSLIAIGQRQFVQVTHYQDKYGLDWHIVTILPESDFITEIQVNVYRTGLLCILTLIVAVGIGIWTSRKITRSLLRLSQVSEAMARGEWTESLNEHGNIAEFNSLSVSFNQMARQLRQSLDQRSTELQEKAYWFNTLIESIPDPIFLKDAQGRFLIINHQGLELFDMTDRNYFGKTDAEMAELNHFYRDALLYCAEIDQIVWHKKAITRTEEQIPQVDGSQRIFDVIRVPLFTETGDRKGFVVIGRDVSDHKQAEIALKQSETRFLEISESSPANIYILVKRVDGSFYFEHMSRAIETIQEVSVEQILENAAILLDGIHPDDLAGYQLALQLSMETLQPFSHEWRIITRSGQTKWLKGKSHPKQRENGEVAWYGVVIDVSDRKLIEESLQQSEARLQTFLNNAPAMIYVKDLEGRYLLINKEFGRALGTTEAEVLGKTDYDLF